MAGIIARIQTGISYIFIFSIVRIVIILLLDFSVWDNFDERALSTEFRARNSSKSYVKKSAKLLKPDKNILSKYLQ